MKENSLAHHFTSISQMFCVCFLPFGVCFLPFSLQRNYRRRISITHTQTHTQTRINFHLLWHWTSSTSKYIIFFLVAFIKHIQDKKSSSLVDISNFSKTEGLSGNQPLNETRRKDKKQKTMKIQFRTEKKFFRDVWS